MNTQTYNIQMKDGWWTVSRGRGKNPSFHATEEQAFASASVMVKEGGKVILHQPPEMKASPEPSKSRKLLVFG